MPKPATIDVVMPVHNGAAFLAAAVESIRAQTYRDWTLLLVDDHSTDDSRRLAEEYAQRDARIKVLANTHRQGIAGALNTGLDAARGEFIARMDADDLALPERFAAQLAYLDTHPDVVLCGSAVQTFGAEKRTRHYPNDPDRLRAFALFNCPFAHPTVLWRRAWFEREAWRYDETMFPEDYELWSRVIARFPAANLDRVLLRYRMHTASSTGADWPRMDRLSAQISAGLLAQLGLPATPDEVQLHRHIAQGRTASTRDFLTRAAAWLERVAAANAASRWSSPAAFHAEASALWFALCFHSAPLGFPLLRAYAAAPCAARGTLRAQHLLLLALAALKQTLRPTTNPFGSEPCAS